MQAPLRLRLWRTAKALLALLILSAIAWQFWHDLQHAALHDLVIRWPWVVLSTLLYLIGMGFSAWYWYRLLVTFGQRPRLLPVLRAYYVSQLGKYIPGKAWAVLMRAMLIQGSSVNLRPAILATIYEVFTTMASGMLLATALLVVQPPTLLAGSWNPMWLALLLLALCGLPLLPAVFNLALRRLGTDGSSEESLPRPVLRLGTLLEGLVTTSGVWLCFGLSLWAMINAVSPEEQTLSVPLWMRQTAAVALACVSGFAAFVMPSGIGVREWVLDLMLTPELANAGQQETQPTAVIIVLLLRMAWTAGEVMLACLLWFVPLSGAFPDRLSAQEG